jgi:hypothetical protein
VRPDISPRSQRVRLRGFPASTGRPSFLELESCRDDGTVVYDRNGAVECAFAEEVILVASELARTAGYIAGIAFSRTSLTSTG